MKKIIFLFLFVVCSVMGFTQQNPTTCPVIVFNYDASGNRIQRKLIITQCFTQKSSAAENTEQSDIQTMLVNIYPNPAQDKINIELPKDTASEKSQIELLDINGKMLYSAASPSLQIQIDVSQYAAGTYFLKITRGEKYAAYNVLKN